MNDFSTELQSLINRHSRENASNTPDYILATYIEDCLEAYERATRNREAFYGTKLQINTKIKGDDGPC